MTATLSHCRGVPIRAQIAASPDGHTLSGTVGDDTFGRRAADGTHTPPPPGARRADRPHRRRPSRTRPVHDHLARLGSDPATLVSTRYRELGTATRTLASSPGPAHPRVGLGPIRLWTRPGRRLDHSLSPAADSRRAGVAASAATGAAGPPGEARGPAATGPTSCSAPTAVSRRWRGRESLDRGVRTPRARGGTGARDGALERSFPRGRGV